MIALRVRKAVAMAICPELTSETSRRESARMPGTADLVRLCDAFADHDSVTHWAVSVRTTGRGDFFQGLKTGAGCTLATYERLISRFDAIWPEDLEWPGDVPRPDPRSDAA